MQKQLLDRINQQIQLELDSANIYLAMSIYFDAQGWSGFAHWMYRQCEEEREHAKEMIDFVVTRGATPAIGTFAPVSTDFNGVISTFEAAYEHECKVSNSINEVLALAIELKDYAAENFYRRFVDEQVEEEATVSGIVDKLKLANSEASFLIMDERLGARK